jgi:hypothetical protein
MMKVERIAKLVSSATQVVSNIRRYNDDAERCAGLMPYARAWYAVRDRKGWLLGPSKFVGYAKMTVEDYLRARYSTEKHGREDQRDKTLLDGRVTEGVLKRWSELVEKGHPDYEGVYTALNELCATYGKKPNTLARISVVKTEHEAVATTFSDDLVALMATVFHGLTPAQQSAFRKQIG